ncbi:hypothetical protein AAGG74_19090 [Bacillus mexicanus]|uniref:hypothetical protein n=1 Tax=Bacillus mexicanus TaxID=2834415 RepID=UPI003D19BD69
MEDREFYCRKCNEYYDEDEFDTRSDICIYCLEDHYEEKEKRTENPRILSRPNHKRDEEKDAHNDDKEYRCRSCGYYYEEEEFDFNHRKCYSCLSGINDIGVNRNERKGDKDITFLILFALLIVAAFLITR